MPMDPDGAAAADGRAARQRWVRGIRVALMIVALSLLLVALASRWSEVAGQLGRIDLLDLGAALLLILLGLVASVWGWRALLSDLGSPLPLWAATRVLFLGQLAKYLPGSSVWAMVAQTELARDFGVPRRRAAACALVLNLMNLGIGLLLALAALPQLLPSPGVPAVVRWTPLLAPLGLALLTPAVLTSGCNVLLRLLRRDPLEHRFSWGGVTRAATALLLGWLCFGLQIGVLAVGLGADPLRVVVPSIGAFAAAWCAGFLVFVIPTGAGTREAVLTLALAPQLSAGIAAALTVAVVSRLLFTVGDLLAATLGFLLGRRSRSRLSDPSDEEPDRPA